MKYLIIGGVAGGATVAARLRRMERESGNHPFRTWKICFLRKLWITLLYRRHDQRPE